MINKYKPWAACALLATLLASSAHAQSGVTDKEILVGQFAAQTGPAAELGKRMQLGMLAHFNAVNAAGGINGRSIRLVSRDDGYEPEKAAAAVKALIEEDKVFALVGSVGTPTTLAAVPAINAAGIPLIGPFTGAQALREPFNRNLFHVRASYFDETESIVQHLSTPGHQENRGVLPERLVWQGRAGRRDTGADQAQPETCRHRDGGAQHGRRHRRAGRDPETPRPKP